MSGPHVVAGPLDLTTPAGWHTRRGLPNPGGNFAFVYLSPASLPSDCRGTAFGGVCSSWPRMTLDPGGIVVAVRFNGMPGSRAPAGGDPTMVAGLPARRSSGSANQACAAIGGSQSITVVLPSVPDASGWMAIDGCIAGPDVATADEELDAILASVTIEPEPSPSEARLERRERGVAGAGLAPTA